MKRNWGTATKTTFNRHNESIYNKQNATYLVWKILHMWHLIPRIVSALLTTKISDLVIHSDQNNKIAYVISLLITFPNPFIVTSS
ncbi:hypothetical protein [Halalkalibacter flavus]|uniref:hypothetical protein n=1 Tax=Halalkalibacter flavus TaxID=3090668 RepID=UPI002FC81A82